MDYFQGVVQEYLRASRTRFVNSECLIQLDEGPVLAKQAHWYCDFVTVDFAERAVFLCEVSYAREMYSLLKRTDAWHANWDRVRGALLRDCRIPEDWQVGVWIFLPAAMEEGLRKRALILRSGPSPMRVKVTALEEVLPWKYRSWNGIPYEASLRQR